jgi:hypothetical protein
LNTPQKVTLAQKMYDDKSNSIDTICEQLKISRATLYRYIKEGCCWRIRRPGGVSAGRWCG